jgi:hypothetical protein
VEREQFSTLVKKRKRWVRSSQENDFDFDGILAGQYNDRSHFIYEILQNAEDAGASKVAFELSEDQLDIYHDGDDFTFKDVEGITGIGESKKKRDPNKIGEFGVGFKSVFAITETPHVYSGTYSFKIEDFVVPVTLDNNETLERTKITLPFKHPQRSSQKVFELVHSGLENIGADALLFLESIEQIEWETPKKSGCHYTGQERVGGFTGVKRVSAISESGGESQTGDYLVFSKPAFDSEKLKVEVAYKLGPDEDGNEVIEPIPNSKLVVFFATEKDTYLDLLIQGPYKTTSNRENIPLDDQKKSGDHRGDG